ncbi:MAG TPA: flavodoxin domain-containing protein [Chloroflexia bacterium]|nr:flavodoxin domain-containing protein [Chloroflexia bacterium]
MSAPILVAYATRYGSTEEVAKAVGAVLREQGLEVEVRPARQVSAIEMYSAVVLGAPFYVGRWHKEALDFLAKYSRTLAERPLAIFALGPLHDDENEWQDANDQLGKELASFPGLSPLTLKVFGGKYDKATLHLPDRLISFLPDTPLKNMPSTDLRDWKVMNTWAGSLAVKLQPALKP